MLKGYTGSLCENFQSLVVVPELLKKLSVAYSFMAILAALFCRNRCLDILPVRNFFQLQWELELVVVINGRFFVKPSPSYKFEKFICFHGLLKEVSYPFFGGILYGIFFTCTGSYSIACLNHKEKRCNL